MRVKAAILLTIAGLLGTACASEGLQAPPALHAHWRATISVGQDPPSTTPATDASHVFVVGSTVQAYALATGRLLWQTPLHSYVPRSLLTVAGLVVVPEAIVSALDAATGRPAWEFTPDANTSLGRAATDGASIYVGTASHRVYALAAATGQARWSTDLGPGWTYPAVVRGLAPYGGMLYAAVEQRLDAGGRSSAGWLVALDASTGRVLWRSLGTAGVRQGGLSSAPAVTDQLVIAADFPGNAVVAFDRRSGQPLWRYMGEAGRPGFPEAPIVIGDSIYAGSGDTYAYSLTFGGALRWRTKLQASIESYAWCGHGLVLNDQSLTLLDPASGQVLDRELDDTEYPTSGLAVRGGDAFLLGPKAVYAYRCT